VLAVLFVGLLMRQYFSLWVSALATALVMVIVLVIFRQRLQHFYHRIEQRFLKNLHAKEKAQAAQRLLAPWDAHLSRIRISPSSLFIGKSLEELAIREQYGINVAFIERGNKLIYAPSRFEKLFPYDEIGVIGTDIQLQKFTLLVEAQAEDAPPVDVLADEIILQKLVVDEHNGLKGQTIRESGIREKTNGLVVGIERGGERILNPSSFTVFEWEDIVWLVGDRRKITRHYFATGHHN
jgi:CPA2 family monovalent cation:H+ antiporter-2